MLNEVSGKSERFKANSCSCGTNDLNRLNKNLITVQLI